MIRRRVTVLGSTGSVGSSTLDLMAQAEASGTGTFEVEALTGGANIAKLAEQARRWKPRVAVTADPTRLDDLRAALVGSGIAAAAGEAAIVEAATRPADWIMASIVGAAGLKSAWAAAGTGATLALANKESLVCCGPALIERVRRAGGRLIPVDSEHSAIFQVFPAEAPERVSKLILTASGGPFRQTPRERMGGITPEQAVAHTELEHGRQDFGRQRHHGQQGSGDDRRRPICSICPRIGSTWVVHPESIIHSLVEYVDGSTLAQMGPPDMRTPIACALAWPDRIAWPAPRLDLAVLGRLTFETPDLARFPALNLARQALKSGGAAPAVFNAANEVAAFAFLDRKLAFLNIAAVVAETLERATKGGDGFRFRRRLRRGLVGRRRKRVEWLDPSSPVLRTRPE